MSALAQVCLTKGCQVSGSDLFLNNLTDELEKEGALIYSGHASSNVPNDADLVVKSTCIRNDNPEIIQAKDLEINIIPRSDLLKMLMKDHIQSVAVTGTHGKTTTSALISHITEYCGKRPTIAVGGEIGNIGSNAKFGDSGLMVAEVDESDGHFKGVESTYALITNIEREHMEHYDDFNAVLNAYGEFISNIAKDGVLFFNGGDPVLSELALKRHGKRIDFGMAPEREVSCKNIECAKSIEFDLVLHGKTLGRAKSSLIGKHNVMNITGAIAVCLELGLEFNDICNALKVFGGVKRRFERVGRVDSIEVIEDYAHHPTEISSTIRAAKDYGTGRVITVFQPHRYSRTRDLAEEFHKCFYDSDILILTDIYSAYEDTLEKTSTGEILKGIDKNRFESLELIDKENIPEYVSGIVKDNDIVLVLGAGDIREIAMPIVERIKKARKTHAK